MTLRRSIDWLLVADPGLAGLRQAAFAVLGAAGAVLLGTLLLTWCATPVSVVALILPGVVGALGSTMLSDDPVPHAWRLGLAFGGVAAGGATAVALLPDLLGVQMAVLVGVTIAATWLRRYAGWGTALGLALWLGAVVTVAQTTARPPLLFSAAAPLLAGGCLAVLSMTVFRTRPSVGFAIAVRGLRAAAERVLALRGRGTRSDARRTTSARISLLRSALVADALLQRTPAGDAEGVRLAIIRLHAAADRVARAAESDSTADRDEVRRLAARLRTPGVAVAPDPGRLPTGATLTHGTLPGLQPAAGRVPPGARRAISTPPSAVTRQTLQLGVAALLATLAGAAISPDHLVWPLLAVFTVLSGPAVTALALPRALGRTAGTAAGIVVGLSVGHLLGATPALLVVSALGIVGAFWIQSHHYAVAMMLGTVAIAGLYRMIDPSPTGALLIRLLDTAIGGACAMLVVLVFWPVSTRVVDRAVRNDLVDAERSVGAAQRTGDRSQLAAAVIQLDQTADALLRSAPSRHRPDSTPRTVLDRVGDQRSLA